MEREGFDIYFSNRLHPEFGIIVQFTGNDETDYCFVRNQGDELLDLTEEETSHFLLFTARKRVEFWQVEYSTVEPEITGECLLSLLENIEQRFASWVTRNS